VRVRQSDLKTWQKCPLIYRFQNIDGLQREQSGSLTYGSIIHHCVQWLEEHRDLDGAIALFQELWIQPTLLDPTYQPQYYVRGTNWKKFMDLGPKVLRDWWSIFSWDAGVVLAREHSFEVPIGDGHTLHGTVDKLEISYKAQAYGGVGGQVLKIVDFKTDKKQPTYDYLAEDLQFSSYAYASTQREFWINLGGDAAWQRHLDLERHGEWIQLNGPKRMDAGIRTQRHYNRIEMAVNALAESVGMRIFVPTISGETCRYCEFREPCGLPELDDNGEEVKP
jgi:hypothetical protein